MNRYLISALAAVPAVLCAPAQAADDMSPAEAVVSARVVAVSVVLQTLADDAAERPDQAAQIISRVTEAIQRARAHMGGTSAEVEQALAEMEQQPMYAAIMRDLRRALDITERNNYYGSETLHTAITAFLELM